MIGKGWTSVVELDGVQLGAATGKGGGSASTDALMKALRPVSGAFGTGRLLKTNLLSVLLLDNGKAYVGAVSPAMIEQAAATASK